MVEELEKVAGLNIPNDLSGEEANRHLEACAEFDVECPPLHMTGHLLDRVTRCHISAP